MVQISNKVFCDKFLIDLDIETKLLTNPYYDSPFLVIKNFLSESRCSKIVETVKKNQDAIDAKIRQKGEILLDEALDTTIRKTKLYDLDDKNAKIYEKSFLRHQKEIEDFFSVALTTSTKIQTLEYTKGCFYKQHSDDSNVLVKDNVIIGFLPVAPQRKVTSVLFTTSCNESNLINSFSGGELVFNYLYDENGKNITLKPQAGDMVLFLSNPYFTHEVLEVKSGYRLTLVQWHDALVN
ncbi:MAG: 2OG-Fe(II) oxygenase [Candidatus Marinarcus sp.]|uniref:2OG-Fe(II) oxygenase n=1 Tax=Candidatus Marinarcus sp. TaxID=3100987 RepID=UPI003B00D764